MRATISRISRRANCSPGSIYKIYPSKEDLVIAAVRAVMQAPWIALTNFNDILEEGSSHNCCTPRPVPRTTSARASPGSRHGVGAQREDCDVRSKSN